MDTLHHPSRKLAAAVLAAALLLPALPAHQSHAAADAPGGQHATTPFDLSTNIILRYWRIDEPHRPGIALGFANALKTVGLDKDLAYRIQELTKDPNNSIRLMVAPSLQTIASDSGPLAMLSASQRSSLAAQITPQSASIGFFLRLPKQDASQPALHIFGIGMPESLAMGSAPSWMFVGNLHFQLSQHLQNAELLLFGKPAAADSSKLAYRATTTFLRSLLSSGKYNGATATELKKCLAVFEQLSQL